MQITFLEKLITILRKKQSYAKGRYKSKKVNDFFLSKDIGFVYR